MKMKNEVSVKFTQTHKYQSATESGQKINWKISFFIGYLITWDVPIPVQDADIIFIFIKMLQYTH